MDGDLIRADLLVRGAAAGAFAVLGAVWAVTPLSLRMRLVGVLFFVTVVGHALANCGLVSDNSPIGFGVWAMSALGTGMFWLFVVTLFTDQVRFPLWHLAPPVLSIGLALIARLGFGLGPSPAWGVYDALSIVFVAHALALIWQGWRDDLVETRRRLRAPVMGAAALYVLLIAISDMDSPQTTAFAVVSRSVLVLLALAGAVAMFRPDPDLLGLASGRSEEPAPVPAADQVLLARLNSAMEDGVWRREDLTIGALAAHLSVPEHRLRRLINGALGQRNFAGFINSRRIEAAKRDLRDPDLASRSVASIAYDLGFGSLGPFNRAFRDVTGTTPTAWRASPISEMSGQN